MESLNLDFAVTNFFFFFLVCMVVLSADWSIFATYFSMGLLGEMMVILNCCFVAEDRDVVMEILTVLSRSLRFSLSLTFLVQAERKAVRLYYCY